MSVLRHAPDSMTLITAGAAQWHDGEYLRGRLAPGLTLEDRSADIDTLIVTGPKSRATLGAIAEADLSRPWLTHQTGRVAGRPALLARVSFAGEMGWEIHAANADMPEIYEAVLAGGATPFGMWALNSLRLEKAYRAWKGDLSTDYSLLEAGLDRFIRFDKPQDFPGKAALLSERQRGVAKRFAVLSVDAGEADAPPMSTLWHEGVVVGEATSGGWGYRVGASIALAMLRRTSRFRARRSRWRSTANAGPRPSVATVRSGIPATKGSAHDLPPERARAVIIGGGVSGCSVAYHLAKAGWTDIVLLERRQLTCGTTWHAAGLIGQLRGSQNMTRLAKYSADLYVQLEAETGIATGMRQVGSISVALTDARREELLRQATLARAFGVEVHEIGAAEVAAMYPHLNIEGMTGAVHLPLDGQCDPANIAMALAKGARMRGATIVEGATVAAVTDDGRRVTGVDWVAGDAAGHIAADVVINCGGMWGRELAARSGVTLPLHACEHFYLVTEPYRRARPPSGAARARRMRLLQVGRRKDDARRLRAQGEALGHGGHPRGLLLRLAARGFRPFRTDPRDGHAPDAAVPDRWHTHLLQRSRKFHARRPLLPRRVARTRRLLGRGGLQFDRHRLLRRRGHGARALDHRRRAALRSLGGGHPPGPAVPA